MDFDNNILGCMDASLAHPAPVAPLRQRNVASGTPTGKIPRGNVRNDIPTG